MCDACFDRRTLDVEASGERAGVWLADDIMEEALRELPMYTK
jgi:hypothetical protein